MQFSPFWINFNDIHRLQLLQDVASYGTTAFAEMRRPASIPLAPSIDFLETANPDTLPQVDFSSHWSFNTVYSSKDEYQIAKRGQSVN